MPPNTTDNSGMIPDSAEFIEESTLIPESTAMNVGAIDDARLVTRGRGDGNDGGLPKPAKAAIGGAFSLKKNAPFIVVGVIATVLIGSVAYKSLVGGPSREVAPVTVTESMPAPGPSDKSQTMIIKPMEAPQIPQMPQIPSIQQQIQASSMPPAQAASMSQTEPAVPALQAPTTTVTTTTTTLTPSIKPESQLSQPINVSTSAGNLTSSMPPVTMPVITANATPAVIQATPTTSMPPTPAQTVVTTTNMTTPVVTVNPAVPSGAYRPQAMAQSTVEPTKAAGPTTFDIQGAEKMKTLTERVDKLEARLAVAQGKIEEASRKTVDASATPSVEKNKSDAKVVGRKVPARANAIYKANASGKSSAGTRAEIARAAGNYSVTAVKDNLVWLKNAEGDIQSFTVGEQIPGIGRLTSVDELTLTAMAGGRRIR